MRKFKKLKLKTQKHNSKFKIFELCAVILVFAFCILSSQCFAQTISSEDLIRNAKDYDGEQVIYEGEIIGDVMQRGDFIWLNVNDANYAIGVHCGKELVGDLDLLAGGYSRRGDWIRVRGVFNHACKIHGGDLDIHAGKIAVIKKGKVLKESINLQKKQIAYRLIGVLLCLLILKLFVTRLRRR